MDSPQESEHQIECGLSVDAYDIIARRQFKTVCRPGRNRVVDGDTCQREYFDLSAGIQAAEGHGTLTHGHDNRRLLLLGRRNTATQVETSFGIGNSETAHGQFTRGERRCRNLHETCLGIEQQLSVEGEIIGCENANGAPTGSDVAVARFLYLKFDIASARILDIQVERCRTAVMILSDVLFITATFSPISPVACTQWG